MNLRLFRPVLLTLAWMALAACRDLDRFDTDDNEAYCGRMVGAPFAHTGFLPDHQPPMLQLRLRLDTDALGSIPGTLSTDDADTGLCSPDPLLDETPMRAIQEAFHDPLSTLEFGDGREHNFFVWVDSSCQGTLIGVISLMKSDDVEIRLLKPASEPLPDAGPAERPGFAFFRLRRRNGDCGF